MSTRVLKKRVNAIHRIQIQGRSYVASRSQSSTPSVPVASTSRLPTRPLHIRTFHATPRHSILPFFGLGARDTPTQHAATFLKHLRNRDTEKLCTAYQVLRESLLAPGDRRNPPEIDKTSLLTHEDLFEALKLLSSTAHIHTDYATMETIFHDITSLWEFSYHQRKDHHFYIVGLVNSGRIGKAEQWLTAMAESGSSSNQPRSADWNVYLKGLRQLSPISDPASTETRGGGYAKMKSVIMTKVEAVNRDLIMWNTLLAALFECRTFEDPERQIPREVQWVRAKIKKGSMQEDATTFSTILSGYTDCQYWEQALEARKELLEFGGKDAAGLDTYCWNTLVKYAIAKDGLQAGLAVVEQMKAAGQKPDSVTLNTALASVVIYVDRTLVRRPSLDSARSILVELEQSTGVISDHKTYATLMHQAHSFEDALQLYADAQRDGVSVSSNMLRALIHHTGGARPTDVLKTVYADLLQSELSTAGRSKSGMYDVGLYILLLQYCARKVVRDFAWAIQLLEDVRHNGLSFLNSSSTSPALSTSSAVTSASASSLVTSLMRNVAQDHSQAFKIYSWMWAIDESNIFSHDDWYDIIRTFADLDFPPVDEKRSYVPASVFFAFFEDMRKSGNPPDSKVYQAVLYYYAREGKQPSARANQDAVRQIHDLIKMDQFSDTPDIGLMNRLMYAYAKVGNLEGTFNVWRSILVNRIKFNNVSVSIILDAYGFAGGQAYPQLVKLWNTFIRQPDFYLNKKNLESYVEALCRLDHPREAVDEVFGHLERYTKQEMEMLRYEQRDRRVIGVDEQTLQILLKFIRSDDALYAEAMQRLENSCPELIEAVHSIAPSIPAAEREVSMLSGRDDSERNYP